VQLVLDKISRKQGADDFLYPMSLALVPGAINVLLGTTRAGKTTLMRVMAGLDKPSAGTVTADGVDVTGVPVSKRNLAMVYQQFINYPGLSVYENIASPLRLKKLPQQEIHQRVTGIAEKLHIAHLLQRLPGELSGGQQQRTALARALIKRAPLVLLDEPLVNLDYKLREELRSELISLFTNGDTTVVYATTEPQEALLLGGHTAVMHAGRLLQFGPTLQLFNAPASTQVASIFNDPPMNMLAATAIDNASVTLDDGSVLAVAGRNLTLTSGQRCQVGVRCNDVRLQALTGAGVTLACTVGLAELSGSETYLHLRHGGDALVAQLPGVHALEIGSAVQVHINAAQIFLFDTEGRLLSAPEGD
jgi:glycerol transport system ATP-binding protein